MLKPQALFEAGLRELRLTGPRPATDSRKSVLVAALTLLRALTVLAAVAALASLSTPPAQGASPQAAERARVEQVAPRVAGELKPTFTPARTGLASR